MENDPWDEFSATILSSQDKLLFDEATRAARSSALRAAYIMVWLSCAESIKRKFKELSPRDGTAKHISGECDRKEQAHQSVDHFLLEKAKDYGLITATEFTKLEQIYVFRCIYGHPYEIGPTVANLVSAASDVTGLVLCKTTKLRHGYLSSQIEHLITKASFLDDRWEATERFAADVAQKCDDSLHWWFLKKLWERAELLSGDASLELFFRRAVWFSSAYLRQISITKPWSAVDELVAFPNILSCVLVTPDLFLELDEHSKEQVLGILIDNSRANPAHLSSLKLMNDAGCFDERMRQRFLAAIAAHSIEDLAAIQIDPNLYLERIIANLKSYNWYVQNPAITVVRNMGPSGVGLLSPRAQFLLGNNILQAADGSAKAAIDMLVWAGEPSHSFPEAFVDGIISECFINDSNQIRFKQERLPDALTLLKRIDLLKANELVQRLAERLGGGRIKNRIQPDERDEVVSILQKFIAQNPDYKDSVSELIILLAKLEIEKSTRGSRMKNNGVRLGEGGEV